MQGGVCEIFDPLRVHPIYTFLSSNYTYNNSYFLVARDGVTNKFKLKKHLPSFTTSRFDAGRIPPSAGQLSPGGDPCRDLKSFSTNLGSD